MPIPPDGAHPVGALLMTTAGFVALTIFAFGMTSLATDQDVIATPGVGQTPGIVGVAAATAVFAASVWTTLRRPQPAFAAAVAVALGVYLAYLAGVGIAAVVTGVDLGVAAGVVGALAIGPFGPLVAVAALACALVAVALVRAGGGRSRAERPRWPWERPGAG